MALLDRTPSLRPPGVRPDQRWLIPAAAALAVVGRLPFLWRAASPDEAGFLMVGSHWHAGGTSLYGSYWVDRPPLLIALFQLASASGGLPALRLLGCLAAALIVVGSAVAGRLIAGERAGRWAAMVAAALCVTPALGFMAVDGELLAGPFVVGSIAAAVAALRTDGEARARRLAMAAGAAAMCALLVKQNMADAFVFGVVATAVAWHKGEVDGHRAARVLVSALSGAAVATTVVALYAVLHGTSLGGVFDAMYPFRLEARKAMTAADHHTIDGRLTALLVAAAVSGIAVLLGVVVGGVASRRLRDAASWGLCATLLFGVASVAIGGNYWTHYLLELVGPLAIVAGVLVARGQRAIRPAILITTVASAIVWSTWLLAPPHPMGTIVGHSIAVSAEPGDSIVTVYGHADVVESAGLPSPYPYLWSLPLKTRDPQLRLLDAVITGPRAPTWFVTWHSTGTWGVDSAGLAASLTSDYRVVGRICGHAVYLRDGVVRPTPRAPVSCPTPPAIVNASKGTLR